MGSYPDARPEYQELVSVLRPRAETATPLSRSVVDALERVGATLLLVLLLPLLIVAGLIVVMLSRRSPLVAHERVGRGGELFWVLKLRTMWRGGKKQSGGWFVERLQTVPVNGIKRPDDPRISSRFAAFCRKYSIDELPQLWHVAQGSMSLVGPRPMTPQELSDWYGEAAWEVLRVRPGLTGLWQVRGRSRLSHHQRRRFDLLYVRSWSVRLYLGILLATIPRVVTGKDAW